MIDHDGILGMHLRRNTNNCVTMLWEKNFISFFFWDPSFLVFTFLNSKKKNQNKIDTEPYLILAISNIYPQMHELIEKHLIHL